MGNEIAGGILDIAFFRFRIFSALPWEVDKLFDDAVLLRVRGQLDVVAPVAGRVRVADVDHDVFVRAKRIQPAGRADGAVFDVDPPVIRLRGEDWKLPGVVDGVFFDIGGLFH